MRERQYTIYLLHFAEPYHHARHYIGISRELSTRLELHRRGQSKAKLMTVIAQAGISFTLARTWKRAGCYSSARAQEARLKRRKNAKVLCPLCAGRKAHRRGNDIKDVWET